MTDGYTIGWNTGYTNFTLVYAVSEPFAVVFFGLGLIGLAGAGIKRFKKYRSLSGVRASKWGK